MNYASVEDFVSQQLNLLNLERDAEISESRKLQENTSAKQLQEKGVCLMNLSLQCIRSGLYGRSVASFSSKIVGKELPSTNLSSGDIVGIFPNGGTTQLEKDQICSGIISCTKTNTIEVALDLDMENIDLNESDAYKLVKLANNVTYRRLKEGLNGLKNYQGAAANLINTIFGGLPFTSAGISLAPELLNHEGKLVWFNTNLDDSQKQAVEFALKQREVAVVHGPPGTGKTTTVVEIILQAVKAGNRVLACAPSNVAVDNMLEKLVSNSSVKAIRLGHPTRMQESIQNRSLDAVLSGSDARSIVNDVRKDLDAQLKKISSSKKRGPLFSEIKSLRKELRERETKAVKEILSHANVILSTLTSATSDGPLKHLPADHFDYVVIDECSQATEAACWLALTRGPRVLLAGDHYQLPPTILSPEAERLGLGITLMERILSRKEDGQNCVRMLTTQYRMHHEIMQWASDQLYESKLVAHSSVANHLLCQLPDVEENEDTSIPLLLIDTAGCDLHESVASEDGSKANTGEAALVALHVEGLIEAGVPAKDIAIVTPYNLQVDLLRQMLSSQHPALEIRSVDGFQGREKEAIILSLVRSNPNGQVGFVADVRRLNVACTRARRHLCLVTDSTTTGKASSGLVEYMERVGEVRSAHQYSRAMDNVVVPDVGGTAPPPTLRPKVAHSLDQKPSKEASMSNQEKEEIAKRIRTQLEDWSQSADCLAGLVKEFPASLTAHERLMVHQWAEERGFHHRSIGENHERRIVVQMKLSEPKKAEPSEEVTPIQQKEEDETIVETLKERVDQLELESTESKKSKKKKKNRKTDQKTDPEVPATSIPSCSKPAASTAPVIPSVPEAKCSTCKKEMPQSNLALHQLRCKAVEDPGPSVKPKQKKPPVKPLPKAGKEDEEEDVDKILSEFRQVDNVCNYATCKAGISLLGQLCAQCNRRFCLSHHLPEVHGCGDAIRRQVRSITIQQGFISAGSLAAKPKAIDSAKRAHLQRRLDKKIQDMTTKRSGQTEDTKKKKK